MTHATARRCAICPTILPPAAHRGRPRLTCSDACRRARIAGRRRARYARDVAARNAVAANDAALIDRLLAALALRAA